MSSIFDLLDNKNDNLYFENQCLQKEVEKKKITINWLIAGIVIATITVLSVFASKQKNIIFTTTNFKNKNKDEIDDK